METRTTSAGSADVATPALQPLSQVRTETRSNQARIERKEASMLRKPSGYGLPCATCHLYYAADLDSCPTCSGNERVAVTVSAVTLRPPLAAEAAPDNALVEQERVEKERDEFLKQFKSQLLEAHEEVIKAPAVCTLGEHPSQDPEPAAICKPCYDRLQERVDVFEAALHIDLKEAAQIVYDAVWADPSEPSKTYTNAASALITELRKRSGASSLLGPFHPLGN